MCILTFFVKIHILFLQCVYGCNKIYSICVSQNMKGIFWQIQLLSLNAHQSLILVKYTFAKRYISKIYLHI